MINKSKRLAGPFLIDLKNKFREIAGEDQLIDRDEFQNGLQLSNEKISDRLFDIFDKDNSGSIDYNEFMGTIESIVNGGKKEKIRFAFDLHDLDSSGFIDKYELKILIKQSFIENDLNFDEFQLDLLVEEFFKRADKDKSGTIDFNEFLDVAHDYPDFIEGFAVNPIQWLIPDRYQVVASQVNDDDIKRKKLKTSLQVQDISLFKWLLIPRFIFFFNVLVNRKKNRKLVSLQSVSLLPSKVLELLVSVPEDFKYTPGDYIYLNCKVISSFEWYPFNIISKTGEGNLVLHVKSNDKWSEKLYEKTLSIVEKDTELDWEIRLDGPYGASSNSIIATQHAILVGAGYGISRMAPILQDIVLRLKNEPDTIDLKRIDLHWIIEDQTYFEWFTKLLQDINDDSGILNYHIYFLNKSPDEFHEKLMYITTNALDRSSNISLINNFWDQSNFGLPNWSDKFAENRNNFLEYNCSVFYSGPRKYRASIKKSCKNIKVPFKKNNF